MLGYGIDNAIDFAINLKVDYCYYNCYSTIFGYDISHCLRLLTWLCHCLFWLFMHLTMTLLWLCVDYSNNHWSRNLSILQCKYYDDRACLAAPTLFLCVWHKQKTLKNYFKSTQTHRHEQEHHSLSIFTLYTSQMEIGEICIGNFLVVQVLNLNFLAFVRFWYRCEVWWNNKIHLKDPNIVLTI